VNIVGVFLSLGRLPGALNEVANSAGLRARADASMGYLVGVLGLFGVIPRLGWVFALIAGGESPRLPPKHACARRGDCTRGTSTAVDSAL